MNQLNDKQLLKLKEMRDKRKQNPFNLEFKVSDKGAISIYGVGRFPVTYYINQWQKIIHIIPLLEQFIHDNDYICEDIINERTVQNENK